MNADKIDTNPHSRKEKAEFTKSSQNRDNS